MQASAASSPAGTFISPFGITQALGMLLNGADPAGRSYSQLLSTVFGGGSSSSGALGASEVNAGMAQLASTLLQVRPAAAAAAPLPFSCGRRR